MSRISTTSPAWNCTSPERISLSCCPYTKRPGFLILPAATQPTDFPTILLSDGPFPSLVRSFFPARHKMPGRPADSAPAPGEYLLHPDAHIPPSPPPPTNEYLYGVITLMLTFTLPPRNLFHATSSRCCPAQSVVNFASSLISSTLR